MYLSFLSGVISLRIVASVKTKATINITFVEKECRRSLLREDDIKEKYRNEPSSRRLNHTLHTAHSSSSLYLVTNPL